jgi:aryl-alcohol dehydrogenase-like predicted oxidoreductase
MSIPTTRLGRTGLSVSRLALGTMTFGLQTDEATSHRILDKATEGGINLLDTADVYPLGGTVETTGRTEEIVGRWLKAQDPSGRARFIVATKAVGKVGPTPGTRVLRASTCLMRSMRRSSACRPTTSTCTSCITTTARRHSTKALKRST